jgi:uncharacterized membrane protein YbaN (DUF454 family)
MARMSGRVLKALLIVAGTISVALGVIGIFLPLMPTTVFLLLAAACYARSSDRFYQRLISHPYLGVYIRNSREGRGMRFRDKAITLGLLWGSIAATATFSVDAQWLRLLLVAIALAVTVHVARIPAFRESASVEQDRASS